MAAGDGQQRVCPVSSVAFPLKEAWTQTQNRMKGFKRDGGLWLEEPNVPFEAKGKLLRRSLRCLVSLLSSWHPVCPLPPST